MNGKVLLGAVLMTFAGSASAQTIPNPPSATVKSHAIIYQTGNGLGGTSERFVDIIVQQPGAIHYMICQTDAKHPPSTPAQLSALVNDPVCEATSPQNINVDVFKSRDVVVHQKENDTYVFLRSSLAFGRAVTDEQGGYGIDAGASVITFDPSDTSALRLLSSFIIGFPKVNPKISTDRVSELKLYEADVLYPEITEKPYEQ